MLDIGLSLWEHIEVQEEVGVVLSKVGVALSKVGVFPSKVGGVPIMVDTRTSHAPASRRCG